jgi:hypothetical protein
MEYKILRESSVEGLSVKVNEAMKDGWRLHGDLAVDGTADTVDYVQAMVREGW